MRPPPPPVVVGDEAAIAPGWIEEGIEFRFGYGTYNVRRRRTTLPVVVVVVVEVVGEGEDRRRRSAVRTVECREELAGPIEVGATGETASAEGEEGGVVLDVVVGGGGAHGFGGEGNFIFLLRTGGAAAAGGHSESCVIVWAGWADHRKIHGEPGNYCCPKRHDTIIFFSNAGSWANSATKVSQIFTFTHYFALWHERAPS